MIGSPGSTDRRLRVVYFVSPSEHFAGIERVVHEIASGLMEHYGDRLEVHVLFSTRYDEAELVDVPYTMHVLGADRLLAMPVRIRSVLRRLRPDVLICPQVEASVIGWVASRGLGVRLFVTHLHGNPLLEESEGTLRTRIAFHFFRHLVSRRIAAILAVAPSLQRFAEQSLTRGAPVYFVPNPVRRLPPSRQRTRGPEPFRFVNVGRLTRQKGQDLLIQAFAAARPDLPVSVLRLVGQGPDRDSLEVLARRLGVDDAVEFAGYATDPSEHLSASDCFVLASRWEGFGLVLIEALQYGLPLLAADCRFGPSDIIDERALGELVPTEDVPAMAAAMVRAAHRIWTDQDRARRIEVAAQYDRGAASSQHFDVIRQLVDARAGELPDLGAPAGHRS